MKQNDPPIKNCYRVKSGCFLAGEYPRDYEDKSSYVKISALIEAGVSLFVDLTEEDDGLKPYEYIIQEIGNSSTRRIPCPITDLSIPRSREYTNKILDIIDAEIDDNGMVYAHCWGGVGRTGTVVGCWLSRHGYKGEAALKKLKELWQECPKSFNRDSPETDEQRSYVLNWDEG